MTTWGKGRIEVIALLPEIISRRGKGESFTSIFNDFTSKSKITIQYKTFVKQFANLTRNLPDQHNGVSALGNGVLGQADPAPPPPLSSSSQDSLGPVIARVGINSDYAKAALERKERARQVLAGNLGPPVTSRLKPKGDD